MFLILGAGFAIATFVLLIEITEWIIRKIIRKFILEKNVDQDSAVLYKSGDMRHESKSNEQHETLVHDYRDQPGFRKRHAYSAGARFGTCEDLDEKSDDKLQYFISLHSMTSLPAINSPRLKNRRMQTPKTDYIFTAVGEGAISGDEITEDTHYDGYRKYEEAISQDSKFQTGNLGDQYFGDELQEKSYHTFEKDDTSIFQGFMENQDSIE
jgi:hypothetical protein